MRESTCILDRMRTEHLRLCYVKAQDRWILIATSGHPLPGEDSIVPGAVARALVEDGSVFDALANTPYQYAAHENPIYHVR